MPPKVKKPKNKQKQKQRQSQKVVVNIHTGTKRKSSTKQRRRSVGSGGLGGGGGNFVSYPVYTNAPSDYAPIIHNLPAQFQNQPAITMPTRALENIPTFPTITFPTPTTLQTVNEDERSLASSIQPLSIDTRPPPPRRVIAPPTTTIVGGKTVQLIAKPLTLMEELKIAQAKKALKGASLGSTILGSNILPSAKIHPFEEELQKSLSARASRTSTPIQFTNEASPSIFRPVARRSTPSPMSEILEPVGHIKVNSRLTEDQKREQKKAYDAERYKNKKMGTG